jgi:CBS-domain-containing membrane protein
MFVSEIMSTCVAECTEDMGLDEVYELIGRCEHRLVVVIDSHAHRVPIGVVSERSICEQIIGRGRNPRTLSVAAVIDPRIATVRADGLVETIVDRDVAAVVVIDSKRRVCGVVPGSRLGSRRPRVVNSEPPTIERKADRPAPRVSEIPAFGWIQ